MTVRRGPRERNEERERKKVIREKKNGVKRKWGGESAKEIAGAEVPKPERFGEL